MSDSEDMVAEGSPVQPEPESAPAEPKAAGAFKAVHGLTLADGSRVEEGDAVPPLDEDTLAWLLSSGHIKESE